jgi:hypothetical protein
VGLPCSGWGQGVAVITSLTGTEARRRLLPIHIHHKLLLLLLLLLVLAEICCCDLSVCNVRARRHVWGQRSSTVVTLTGGVVGAASSACSPADGGVADQVP